MCLLEKDLDYNSSRMSSLEQSIKSMPYVKQQPTVEEKKHTTGKCKGCGKQKVTMATQQAQQIKQGQSTRVIISNNPKSQPLTQKTTGQGKACGTCGGKGSVNNAGINFITTSRLGRSALLTLKDGVYTL